MVFCSVFEEWTRPLGPIGSRMRPLRHACALLACLGATFALAAPRVELLTTEGRVVIELDDQRAPISTQNFLTYVRDKHYDGVIFHRVIPGFMVQSGGYDAKLNERPARAPIKNEASNGLKNVRGSIALARSEDLNSASAQFYINAVDNPTLDGLKYTVFGSVVDGMDIVDKIELRDTKRAGTFEALPVETVTIERARVLE